MIGGVKPIGGNTGLVLAHHEDEFVRHREATSGRLRERRSQANSVSCSGMWDAGRPPVERTQPRNASGRGERLSALFQRLSNPHGPGSRLRVTFRFAARLALWLTQTSRRRFRSSHSIVSSVQNTTRTSQRFQMRIGSSEWIATGRPRGMSSGSELAVASP